jgi:hypothetical protein
MAIYYNNQLKDFYYGGNFFVPSTITGKIYYGNVLVNEGYNPYDANASEFIFAAGISGSTANAVNQLVLDLKSYNLWNEMYAIYPLVGGTYNSCKYNLKDIDTYTLLETGSTGTITYSNLGVTFPGNSNTTSKVLDTQFKDTGSNWSYDSASMGYYINSYASSSALGFPYIMGCRNSPNPNNIMGNNYGTGVAPVGAGSFLTSFMPGNTYPPNNDNNNEPVGLFTVCTDVNYGTSVNYKNGEYTGQSTGIENLHTNINIFLGGVSNQRSFQGRLCFGLIGKGLTGTQNANLNTAVYTFQVTLGRNA